MAAPIDSKTALANFKAGFATNNKTLSNATDPSPKIISDVLNKNIQLINDLLTSLMGEKEAQAIAQAANTQSLKQTIPIPTNTTAAIPTYNVRTPYVEIWLNGAKAIPTIDMSKEKATNALKQLKAGADPGGIILSALGIEVLFSDLELTMPFGGVNSTITGTLKLFSRTPIDLLTFLTNGLAEDTPTEIGSVGLPICELKLGWKFADGLGSNEIISPFLSFLVTNIQMTDPGKTIGSEFTLSLQDAGSASLGNTSANTGIFADYPQQQLRVIIEKLLGMRLFTLDDLLQVANGGVETTETGPKSDIAWTSPATNAPTQETFFVNPISTAIRINCNTLQNVITELLNYISCRWYPVSNATLETAKTDAGSAEDNIRELKRTYIADLQKATSATQQEKEDITKKYQEDLDKQSVKLAGTCILIYVPNFPVGIKTSSGNYYNANANISGAYVLLPKYMADNNLNAANLPIIYGPGGSGIPYFYGGGQNVFQRLTDVNASYSKKGFSNTVGEVSDLVLNFNSYIAVMKNRYDEHMMTREEGNTLAVNKAVRVNNLTPNAQAILQQKQLKERAKSMGYVDKKGNILKPEDILNIWQANDAKLFQAQGIALTGTLAQIKFLGGDSRAVLQNSSTGKNGSSDNGRSYKNQSDISNLGLTRLNDRIGTFLQYPLTIGMTVLGDPFLLRQGIGAFELINYYPTADGETFKFNPIVSGAYVPQTIIHRISLGEYITEIRALKVPNQIANTATASYIQAATLTQNNSTTNADLLANYNAELDELMNVKLTDLQQVSNIDGVVFVKNQQQQQTQTLTNIILTGPLKEQMDATFNEFNTINGIPNTGNNNSGN